MKNKLKMGVDYHRWTLAQRASLAQTVAARVFDDFVEMKKRNPAMNLDHVANFIANETKTQAFLANINPKYYEETAQLAVDFYNRYLAQAMEIISKS